VSRTIPPPGPDRIAQCRALLELYGSDAETRIVVGGPEQVRMRARVIACSKGIEVLDDARDGDREGVLAARRRLLRLEDEARRQFGVGAGGVEGHLADELRGVLQEFDRVILGWEH
jgi:hypothetical protein